MKTLSTGLLALIFSLVLVACGAPREVQQQDEELTDTRMTQTVDYAQNLADFLVRAPGVFLDDRGGGTVVLLRGQRPLFVLDGIPIGYSYYEANSLVNAQDISSIEVLTGVDASARYGLQGANGVIVIHTR